MYLTALLGDGLSKEYVRGNESESEETKAMYFFNKMIDDDETRIIQSWRKAQVRGAQEGLPRQHARLHSRYYLAQPAHTRAGWAHA